MSWVATAVLTVGITGSVISGNEKKDAARKAARSQLDASGKAIEAQEAQFEEQRALFEQQRQQFEEMKTLVQPYIEAGEESLGAQMGLAGLGGEGEQARIIKEIQQSPEFQALTRQGEEGILQNVSATGGLRGGNVQGALAQFRPQLLSGLIDQRFNRLNTVQRAGQTGLSRFGQASSNIAQSFGQEARARETLGSNIANLNIGEGAIRSGRDLAIGQAGAEMFGDISQLGGQFFGGGF